VQYLATVGVGSPATDYSLIVDTGSSNTWVGAGCCPLCDICYSNRRD